MNTLRSAALICVVSLSTAQAAGTFDGSAPLQCSAEHGHDCLPTTEHCSPMHPQGDKPAVFNVDFAKKEIRSPFRTEVLKASHSIDNSESLMLQGSDLLFAWSALVNKASGAFTVSIADRKGAYVVFGQCKAAKPMT